MTTVKEAGNGPLWAEPLHLPSGRADFLSAQQVQRWIWFLVALSVAARLIRYAMRLPLWADEAFLAANFLDRG